MKTVQKVRFCFTMKILAQCNGSRLAPRGSVSFSEVGCVPKLVRGPMR